MEINKSIHIWLQISTVVLILMIIVGGATRLTNSGLSIVHWKPITGVIPPLSLEQWEHSFNEYKNYPEFKLSNSEITLSNYKYIYYWEYLHRLLGRFIGFLFIIPFSFFLIKGYLNRKLIKQLLFIFLLGIIQGFIGWFMVKSGLVLNPYVSHYRLALHLIIAFFILSNIYKIKLSLMHQDENKISNFSYYNNFINIVLLIIYLQVIYGAFNAGLKTVNIYNTFPFFNNNIIPSDIFSMKPIWLNFFENNSFVQFIHRYLAVLVLILCSVFCFKINTTRNRINFNAQYLIILVLFQCMLGILTLNAKAPIIFSLTHQLLASLLILTVIKIKHLLRFQ